MEQQMSEQQTNIESWFQKLINKTSVAYSAIDELDQVFTVVVDWLTEVLTLDQNRIVLLDDSQKSMRVVADYIKGSEKRPFSPTTAPVQPIGDSAIIRQLVTNRAPLIISQGTTSITDLASLTTLYNPQRHTFMLIPIVVGATTIGLICCASNTPRHFTTQEMQLAQTVANLLATRLEQTRLFQAERQRRLEAETLQSATVSLTATIDQTQILNNLLYHLERVIQYHSASVVLQKEDGLVLVASRHFSQKDISFANPIIDQSPIYQRLRKSQRPIIINNIHEEDEFAIIPGFEYIHSWMGIPLLVHDQVIGYFGIDHKEIGVYTEHQATVAQAFANQAAAAIANARLFAQVEKQANALRVANESLRREIAERQLLEDQVQQSLKRRTEQVYISTEVAQEIAAAPALDALFRQVVNLVKERFAYYHAQVYTLEGDYLIMQEGTGEPGQIMKELGHRISLRAKKGLVATAVLTGRPALATDVTTSHNWLPNRFLPDTRSEIAIPIILKDEVLGALDVQSDKVAGINKEDEILLLGLCGQIGVAINNRRLDKQRVQAEQSLKAYTLELEQSNQELEDFAYVASHDLQEPLRKIQAFGSRLRQKYGPVLDERGLDYLSRMESAAARMQTLINDLLTFSRITTKAEPFVPVNLDQLVQVVLLDLEIKIGEVNGRFHISDLPTIEADPTQMRQLLQNLISNALKFHRPGHPPVINIESTLLDEAPTSLLNDTIPGVPYCQITVSDNGIGFDEKYADRIFTVFQRLHSRNQYEGTGVGLALCRKIAERHRGTIKATSKIDEGATFIVTLPLKQKDQKE